MKLVEARTSQWLYCKGRWPNEKIYLAGVIIFENCNKWANISIIIVFLSGNINQINLELKNVLRKIMSLPSKFSQNLTVEGGVAR